MHFIKCSCYLHVDLAVLAESHFVLLGFVLIANKDAVYVVKRVVERGCLRVASLSLLDLFVSDSAVVLDAQISVVQKQSGFVALLCPDEH